MSQPSSPALLIWRTESKERIGELITAHQALSGTGPGRRTTTVELNHMLLLKVFGEFQNYVRNLYTLCAEQLRLAAPPAMAPIFVVLADRRQLKIAHGNPNPSNITQDFSRLNIKLWDDAAVLDPKTTKKNMDVLELMLQWRNAITHHDLPPRINHALARRVQPAIYVDRVTLNVVRRGYLP